jgi:hypothetical protein
MGAPPRDRPAPLPPQCPSPPYRPRAVPARFAPIPARSASSRPFSVLPSAVGHVLPSLSAARAGRALGDYGGGAVAGADRGRAGGQPRKRLSLPRKDWRGVKRRTPRASAHTERDWRRCGRGRRPVLVCLLTASGRAGRTGTCTGLCTCARALLWRSRSSPSRMI